MIRFATVLLSVFCISAAFGGGPVRARNGLPVKYETSSPIKYKTDLGPLGTFSNQTAVGISTAGFDAWQNVATAAIEFTHDGSLPEDVDSLNWRTYLHKFNDGINPIIFDSHGKVIDSVLGAGASTYVIGFAGSAYPLTGSGQIYFVEGQAVLNGRFSTIFSVEQFMATFIHEFGHFIGLDHSQIHVQYANNSNELDDIYIPTMYPTSVDNDTALATLNIDDIIAVSALYPHASFTSSTGISGTATRIDASAVRGANVLAIKVTDSLMYRVSTITDYLMLENGNYSFVGLDPGDYWISIEPINSNFVGGSSVGPYASYPGDISFQNPPTPEYYNAANESTDPSVDNPNERTVVTVVGGMIASNINILANANLPAAPVLTSPSNGATSVSTDPTLTWNTAADAVSYQLQLSTDSLFATILKDSSGITGTSLAIQGLDLNVRYFWRVRGTNVIGNGPYSATFRFTTAQSGGVVVSALRYFDSGGQQSLWGVDQAAPRDSGFVFGTNFYGDIEKATAFILPGGASDGKVLSVKVWFGYKREGASLPYSIKIYNGNAANGPQQQLFSQEFPITHINADAIFSPPEQPTDHVLSQEVPVNANFFVAVDFGSYGQADWASLGIVSTDTVGMRVSEEWERWNDNNWYNVSDSWFQSRNNGFYMWIEPTVSTGVQVSVPGEQNGLPRVYTLHQNFPNPFNPSTRIRFELPKSGLVTLKVFDLLGRHVAMPVHGSLEAGSHEITFEASGLPSGIYFYAIDAGGFRQTKSMVFLK